MFKKIENTIIKSLLFIIFVRVTSIAAFVNFIPETWEVEKLQGFAPVALSLSDTDIQKYNIMNTYSFFAVVSLFLLIFTYKFAKWRKYNISIVNNWFVSSIIIQITSVFVFVPGLLMSVGEEFQGVNDSLIKISAVYLAFTVFLYIWANITNRIYNKKEEVNKANFDFQANNKEEGFNSYFKNAQKTKKQTPPPRPSEAKHKGPKPEESKAKKPIRVTAEVVASEPTNSKSKKSFFSSFKKTKFSQSDILRDSKRSSIRISGLKGGSVLDKLE